MSRFGLGEEIDEVRKFRMSLKGLRDFIGDLFGGGVCGGVRMIVMGAVGDCLKIIVDFGSQDQRFGGLRGRLGVGEVEDWRLGMEREGGVLQREERDEL